MLNFNKSTSFLRRPESIIKRLVVFGKYLLGSILLAVFLTACGGGGGSTPGGQINIPTESVPVESAPVESQPDGSNNLPEKTVSIAAINLLQNQSVYAGQSFIIKVTSNNGAAATVQFANAAGTPGSITYSPQSCVLNANASCTTTVNVGLTTPVTVASLSYATNIILENSNASNTTANINFKVIEPKLIVTAQPQNIVVGYTTSVGFNLENMSIPNGTGRVIVDLAATSGFVNLVQLNQVNCEISYSDNKIVNNNCNNIQITSPGPLFGETAIEARASYFVSAISNELKIEQSTKPSINITSSLPTGNPASVIAGHSFTLTASSINGAAGTIYFSVTDPGIKLSSVSCTISANNSCQVIATVTLGTPPNLHDIAVDYQSGIARLELTRYRFKSNNPTLASTDAIKAYSVRKDFKITTGFTLPASSVPEGAGTIKVNLEYTPEGIVIGQLSCNIKYAENKIIDNECQNLQFIGASYGGATITAAAYGFTNQILPSIIVPNKFVYVLGADEIIMLGEFADGSLVPIQTQRNNPNIPAIPVEGNPGQMVLSSDNRFLYVTDTVNNLVIPYAIDINSGLPVMQNNLKVATDSNPIKIILSPYGNFAYVTNYGSNTISQYTVNKATGALTANSPAGISSSGLHPVGLVIPNSLPFLYVINQGSNNMARFLVSSTTGRLSFGSLSSTGGTIPSAIAVSPSSKNILIINQGDKSVLSWRLDNNGNIAMTDYVYYPGNILNGVYFNPAILSNSTNLGYLTTDTNVILYQIKANGYWGNTGSLSWEAAAQIGPNTMAFDPSGKYAFIGHQNSQSISKYKIGIDSDGGMQTIGTVNITLAPLGIVVSAN